MKKILSILMPFVGLGIFAWIVHGTGTNKILATLAVVEARDLLVFPVIVLFILLVRGLRWLVLIHVVGLRYSLWKASLITAIGFFWAGITPAKAGDAVRAYYLSRDTGHRFGECFLTVFIDRLMDLVTVLFLGIVAMLLFSYYYIELPSIWIIVAVAVAALGFLYLLLHRELVRRLLRPLLRALTPEKYRKELGEHFSDFYDALGLYGRRWPRTLAALALTLVYWGSILGLAYFVSRALEIEVSVRYLALILPLITLVEVLPISISGLGTRDAATIYFFSILGISSAAAVGFALLYVLMGTYLTAVLGFTIWILRPFRFRDKPSDNLAA